MRGKDEGVGHTAAALDLEGDGRVVCNAVQCVAAVDGLELGHGAGLVADGTHGHVKVGNELLTGLHGGEVDLIRDRNRASRIQEAAEIAIRDVVAIVHVEAGELAELFLRGNAGRRARNRQSGRIRTVEGLGGHDCFLADRCGEAAAGDGDGLRGGGRLVGQSFVDGVAVHGADGDAVQIHGHVAGVAGLGIHDDAVAGGLATVTVGHGCLGVAFGGDGAAVDIKGTGLGIDTGRAGDGAVVDIPLGIARCIDGVAFVRIHAVGLGDL